MWPLLISLHPKLNIHIINIFVAFTHFAVTFSDSNDSSKFNICVISNIIGRTHAHKYYPFVWPDIIDLVLIKKIYDYTNVAYYN